MRYGIDVHGTLACRTADGLRPSVLSSLLVPLMAAWVKGGDEVLVLSGPPLPVILSELAALGLCPDVHFTGVVSMVDYLREGGSRMWEDPPGSNHWWCDPGEWQEAKGRICNEYGIDIVLDDTEAYRAAMPPCTTFCLVHTEPAS